MSRARPQFRYVHSRKKERLEKPTVSCRGCRKVPAKGNVLDDLLTIVLGSRSRCLLEAGLRDVVRYSRLESAAHLLRRAITVKSVARLVERPLVLHLHVGIAC